MKFDNVRTNIGAALIVAFLALASAGVITAQPNSNTRNDTTATRTNDRDNDTDWGWLGLLGLAGLLGLMPKKRTVDVDRDRDVTNRTTGSTSR